MRYLFHVILIPEWQVERILPAGDGKLIFKVMMGRPKVPDVALFFVIILLLL